MAREDIFGVKSKLSVKARVVLNTDSYLYRNMSNLSTSQRIVLDFILKEIMEDTNAILLGGETRDRLRKSTGLSDGTLSNCISKLKAFGYIDKTLLPYEYILHPSLGFKGSIGNVLYYYLSREMEARDECRVRNERNDNRSVENDDNPE
jgi:hypothetical protein